MAIQMVMYTEKLFYTKCFALHHFHGARKGTDNLLLFFSFLFTFLSRANKVNNYTQCDNAGYKAAAASVTELYVARVETRDAI